ncbi:MAG: polysaccharide pyruvyl transferase family protein, partial [Gemmatimonadaceae bacterium]|nr:polysaccharide pyruvyl transferase family protein [Gemmatimonadaceae bacterium]
GEEYRAHIPLLTALHATIDRVLHPLLAGADRVALLGFPTHANVGDSALWLGTLAYLRRHEKTVCYVAAPETYARERLAARLGAGGTGRILLIGGGNFGDTWHGPQALRERVVQDFPDTPIIQLPQSVHFAHPEALARARAILDAHPNLTLLLRDRRSLAVAREHFRAPSVLCPDMAFCLGPLRRPVPATQRIVWLARTDRERAVGSLPADVPTVDWITEPATASIRIERWLRAQMADRPRAGRLLHGPHARISDPVARQRLYRGCALLSAAQVVITDRLHAHILSLLLGIRHVLLDNRDGKVRQFYETWTRSSPITRWATEATEALAIAEEWVS